MKFLKNFLTLIPIRAGGQLLIMMEQTRQKPVQQKVIILETIHFQEIVGKDLK